MHAIRVLPNSAFLIEPISIVMLIFEKKFFWNYSRRMILHFAIVEVRKFR
jgi:hypothetical protein